MRNLAAVLITAVTLTACASSLPPLPAHMQVDRRVGEEPAIGVRTEHSVGDVIYDVYNYEIRRDTSTRLLGPLAIHVLAASALLGPDDAFVAVTAEGLRVHCSVLPVLKVAGEANVAHVCLRGEGPDKQFDQWRSPDGPPARRGWAPLKEKVGYTEQASVEKAQSGSGFKYELLYQGLASGVVSILYREYIDNLARPAFQQALSYTLQPGTSTEVSFRTIRMTIYSADNNGIRYTVTRGLNAQ